MLRITALILFVTGLFGSAILAQGIDFEQGTLEEALAKAKEEGKIIFIDAYADWCAPCKKMDREVFSTQEVGNLFDEHFLAIKVNVEEGDGVMFAANYGVKALPTLLYLDGNGEEVHRSVGGLAKQAFIDQSFALLDEEHQLATLEKRYFEEGFRGVSFMQELTLMYIYANKEEKAREVGAKYLERVHKETYVCQETFEILKFIVEDRISEHHQKALRQAEEFIAIVGEREWYAYLSNIYTKIAIELAIESTVPSNSVINPLLKNIKKEVNTSSKKELVAEVNMRYYELACDEVDKVFMKGVAPYMNEYCQNPTVFNETAWLVYRGTDEKGYLEKAVVWATKAIDKEASYWHLDTRAHLFLKLGRYKEAKQDAEAAMAAAIAQDLDEQNIKDIQALLDEINKNIN